MKYPRLILITLPIILLAACSLLPKSSPAGNSNGPVAAPGTVLWTFPTQGEIWSSPTVQDGMAYFGSDDQSVYAVSVKTQKLKWQFPTEAIVRSLPGGRQRDGLFLQR